jgi:hypothetical protein
MRVYVASFLTVVAALFAAEPTPSEKTLDQKKADWTNDVRTRQEPLVDELESMLGRDTKMTLFAVDPTENVNGAPDGTWLGKKMFRGHVIRSSAPIEDAREQEALIHALTDGMRETDGTVAACFDPYFGLTIEKGDRKIDVLVCFMCLNGRVYGAYSRGDFILSNAHVDAFLSAAKAHGLGLPYRNAIPPANPSH